MRYCPTLRMKETLMHEGRHWMPLRDNRDNRKTNYDSGDSIEVAYKKMLKKYEDTMKWFESLYEPGEEVDAEEYLFLKLPVEEKLKAADADFSYNGLHKSMMPAIGCSSRAVEREHFTKNHKGGLYWSIRVPSLKRDNTTWKRFYNTFPEIAAEVKLGIRRFINGAKLKYIW